jgi:hypothetical protein
MMDNKFAYSCPNCIKASLISAPILKIDTENKIMLVSMTPLKQLKIGKLVNEITCRDKYTLILKPNGNPACVKDASVKKLVERGWGMPNK